MIIAWLRELVREAAEFGCSLLDPLSCCSRRAGFGSRTADRPATRGRGVLIWCAASAMNRCINAIRPFNRSMNRLIVETRTWISRGVSTSGSLAPWDRASDLPFDAQQRLQGPPDRERPRAGGHSQDQKKRFLRQVTGKLAASLAGLGGGHTTPTTPAVESETNRPTVAIQPENRDRPRPRSPAGPKHGHARSVEGRACRDGARKSVTL